MTPHMKVSIAGVAIGLVLLLILPWWLSLAVIAAAIALPVAAWAMLDPSQRRRIRQARNRRQIGR